MINGTAVRASVLFLVVLLQALIIGIGLFGALSPDTSLGFSAYLLVVLALLQIPAVALSMSVFIELTSNRRQG